MPVRPHMRNARGKIVPSMRRIWFDSVPANAVYKTTGHGPAIKIVRKENHD